MFCDYEQHDYDSSTFVILRHEGSLRENGEFYIYHVQLMISSNASIITQHLSTRVECGISDFHRITFSNGMVIVIEIIKDLVRRTFKR